MVTSDVKIQKIEYRTPENAVDYIADRAANHNA